MKTKRLDDYKVKKEVDDFFTVYDLFGGVTDEAEELRQWEESFSSRTRARIKKSRRRKDGKKEGGQ